MNTPTLIPSDAIVFHHNQIRTNSLKVAEAFGKQHKNVIRKLESIDCSPKFNQLNFEPVEYEDAKGEKRPMWEMTKDGFIFLVMGFTGAKAAQVKEAYINAFNAMSDELAKQSKSTTTMELIESELKSASKETKLKILGFVQSLTGSSFSPEKLTPAQQRHIQARVYYMANQPGSSFPSVWRSVKDRFNVGSYKDIPAKRFPELCKYLGAPIPQSLELEGELIAATAGSLGQSASVNYPAKGDKFTYSFGDLHNCGWNTQMDKFLSMLEQYQGQQLSLTIEDISGLRKEFRSLQHMTESMSLRLERARDAAHFAADQLKGPF